jgi:hypothetical protein
MTRSTTSPAPATVPTSSGPIKVAVGLAVGLLLAGAIYLIAVRGLAISLDLSALAGMLCF